MSDSFDLIVDEVSEVDTQEVTEQTNQILRDKEAITNAITNNTDLTEQEAAEVTDNIYDGLQTASVETEQKLNQAYVQIEQMQADVEQTIEEARVKADEAADATAKASMWGFVALLAMLLTSFAGLADSNFVVDKNEERM